MALPDYAIKKTEIKNTKCKYKSHIPIFFLGFIFFVLFLLDGDKRTFPMFYECGFRFFIHLLRLDKIHVIAWIHKKCEYHHHQDEFRHSVWLHFGCFFIKNQIAQVYTIKYAWQTRPLVVTYDFRYMHLTHILKCRTNIVQAKFEWIHIVVASILFYQE